MKMTDVDRLNESFGNGIYVKVSYKDEIRKFKILDHEKPYDDILNVLSRQYDFDSYTNGNVRLSYIDDDDDEITVNNSLPSYFGLINILCLHTKILGMFSLEFVNLVSAFHSLYLCPFKQSNVYRSALTGKWLMH